MTLDENEDIVETRLHTAGDSWRQALPASSVLIGWAVPRSMWRVRIWAIVASVAAVVAVITGVFLARRASVQNELATMPASLSTVSAPEESINHGTEISSSASTSGTAACSGGSYHELTNLQALSFNWSVHDADNSKSVGVTRSASLQLRLNNEGDGESPLMMGFAELSIVDENGCLTTGVAIPAISLVPSAFHVLPGLNATAPIVTEGASLAPDGALEPGTYRAVALIAYDVGSGAGLRATTDPFAVKVAADGRVTRG